MVDSVPTSPTAPQRKPPGRKAGKPQPRKHISLPDGDILIPREELAAELGVTDRTLRSLPLPVTYLSNRAYVKRTEALNIVMLKKTRVPPEAREAKRGRRR
jgi:hypothetical protein